jgi:hypothetical protein
VNESQAEFSKALTEIVHRKARNAGEWLSFGVRDGVTFPGVEIFFLNRVAQVEPEKLDRLLVTGQLDKFVGHLFHNILRGKTLAPWNASQYRRQDVLREIAYSYRRMLSAARSAGEVRAIFEKIEGEIRSGAGEEIPDVALYTQLVGRLEAEVPGLLESWAGDRAPVSKDPATAAATTTTEIPSLVKRKPGRPRKVQETTIDG